MFILHATHKVCRTQVYVCISWFLYSYCMCQLSPEVKFRLQGVAASLQLRIWFPTSLMKHLFNQRTGASRKISLAGCFNSRREQKRAVLPHQATVRTLCLFAGLEGAQRCGQVPLTVWKMFLDASWKCFFFLSFPLLSLVTDHKVSHVEFKDKPQ